MRLQRGAVRSATAYGLSNMRLNGRCDLRKRIVGETKCVHSSYERMHLPSRCGIAYVGENVVMQNIIGPPFIQTMLAQQRNGYARLGDMWRTAQQVYFTANTNVTPSDPFHAPRIWLAIEHLLGDPSMRTP